MRSGNEEATYFVNKEMIEAGAVLFKLKIKSDAKQCDIKMEANTVPP
jgi:isocitrate lyase